MTLRIYPYKFQDITLKQSYDSDTIYIHTDDTVESGTSLQWDAVEEKVYVPQYKYIMSSISGVGVPVQVKRDDSSSWTDVTLIPNSKREISTIIGEGYHRFTVRVPASKYSNRTPVEGVYS